jgi:molecular chaperone GrpE (heat shock protein)
MDPRFEVNLQRRAVPAGLDEATPLVTLAWHALHAEHEERAEERARLNRRVAEVNEFFIRIADEIHGLRRQARGETQTDAESALLRETADRFQKILAEAEVELLAPENVPYDGDLMEYVENTAQQPTRGLAEPHIVEIIAPAVLRRGTLLRMGKAVIAVPAAPE